MVGTHEGKSSCSYSRKRLHEGMVAGRFLRSKSQGLVAKIQTSLNSGLAAGSLQLNFEAEMASSRNGPGLVVVDYDLLQGRVPSCVPHTRSA